MEWKSYPKYPPVKRMVRGRLYLIRKNDKEEALVEFKKIETGHRHFYRLAYSGSLNYSTDTTVVVRSLKGLQIREVPKNELPLFIGWHVHDYFSMLLRGETRKSRIFSQTDEANLIAQARRKLRLRKKSKSRKKKR